MRANQTINPRRADEAVLVHVRPGDDFHVKEAGVGIVWAFPLLAFGTDSTGRRYGFRAAQPGNQAFSEMGPTGGASVGDVGLKSSGARLTITTHFIGADAPTQKNVLTIDNLLQGSGIRQKPPTGDVTIEQIQFLYVPGAPVGVDCVTVVGDAVLGLYAAGTRELFVPYSVARDHTLVPCESDPAVVGAQRVYVDGLKEYGDKQTFFFEAWAVMPDFHLTFTPRFLKANGQVELGGKPVLFSFLGSVAGYWQMTFAWAVDANNGVVTLGIDGMNNQGNVRLAQWQLDYKRLIGTYSVSFGMEASSKTVAGKPFSRMVYTSVPTAPPPLPVSPCQPGRFYVEAKAEGTRTTVAVPLDAAGAHPRPPYTQKLEVLFVPWPSEVGRAQAAGVVLDRDWDSKVPLEMALVTEGQRTTVYAVVDGKRGKGAALSFYGASLAKFGKGYYEVNGPACAPPGALRSLPADEPLTPPTPAPTPSGGGTGSLVLPLAAGGALLVWALLRR